MLPDGWLASTVGDHVELLSGHAFKSEEYISSSDGMKLLRGDNVSQGRLRWRDVKRYPKSKINGLARYQLQVGDFVISMDRTWIPAGVKVSEIFEDDLPCLLVQRVARLRTKPSLRQDLLRQYFSGHRFEQFVQEVQTETAVPHISPNDIKAFEIALPPLPEQKKIAEILSTWDRAIAVQERLIANARAQKKALMQTLLAPKKRLPGFKGEWKTVTLSELAVIIMGSSPSSTAYNTSGLGAPLIQGNADIANRKTAPRMFTTDITQTCKVDDIIFSVRAPVGEISTAIHEACIGRGVAAIRPRLAKDRTFLYYLLLAAEEGWANLSQGSTFQAINSKELKSFQIIVPTSLDERQVIGTIIKNANELENHLIQQLARRMKEKSALMQQLLTGKRRVKIGEFAK